ncbi:MAG: hypothetical protein IJK87_10855 [Prevotella sp.]|nr:hypothetical protein [Prevotella sp.]
MAALKSTNRLLGRKYANGDVSRNVLNAKGLANKGIFLPWKMPLLRPINAPF